MESQTPALELTNVSTHFQTEAGLVKAVDQINFKVGHGETVCVVGESGCGKSVTAMSIMGLVQQPGVVSGTIKLDGKELSALPKGEMRKLRGNALAMIFQEPMSSLNPVLTIGEQLMEPLLEHQLISKKRSEEKGA